MLATDVGDQICWRQLWDVGDGFGGFRHQHPLSFSISVGHQHPKDVTNIEILSPTPENSHQHKVTNIHLSPTSMWPSDVADKVMVVMATFSMYLIGHQHLKSVTNNLNTKTFCLQHPSPTSMSPFSHYNVQCSGHEFIPKSKPEILPSTLKIQPYAD